MPNTEGFIPSNPSTSINPPFRQQAYPVTGSGRAKRNTRHGRHQRHARNNAVRRKHQTWSQFQISPNPSVVKLRMFEGPLVDLSFLSSSLPPWHSTGPRPAAPTAPTAINKYGKIRTYASVQYLVTNQPTRQTRRPKGPERHRASGRNRPFRPQRKWHWDRPVARPRPPGHDPRIRKFFKSTDWIWGTRVLSGNKTNLRGRSLITYLSFHVVQWRL